jgi:hypothetical protein
MGLRALLPLDHAAATYGRFLWRRAALKARRLAFDAVRDRQAFVDELWSSARARRYARFRTQYLLRARRAAYAFVCAQLSALSASQAFLAHLTEQRRQLRQARAAGARVWVMASGEEVDLTAPDLARELNRPGLGSELGRALVEDVVGRIRATRPLRLGAVCEARRFLCDHVRGRVLLGEEAGAGDGSGAGDADAGAGAGAGSGALPRVSSASVLSLANAAIEAANRAAVAALSTRTRELREQEAARARRAEEVLRGPTATASASASASAPEAPAVAIGAGAATIGGRVPARVVDAVMASTQGGERACACCPCGGAGAGAATPAHTMDTRIPTNDDSSVSSAGAGVGAGAGAGGDGEGDRVPPRVAAVAARLSSQLEAAGESFVQGEAAAEDNQTEPQPAAGEAEVGTGVTPDVGGEGSEEGAVGFLRYLRGLAAPFTTGLERELVTGTLEVAALIRELGGLAEVPEEVRRKVAWGRK